MSREVQIADDVAAALGAEEVARLTGPAWAHRVQCWECDGWIDADEPAAITLLRVSDLPPDQEANLSFARHTHPSCARPRRS